MNSNSVDPYAIPLEEAQKWCKNWINLKQNEADLPEGDKYDTSDVRAFLVAKKDLLDLFAQAKNANYVRFYMSVREEVNKGKVPHLLMVNAIGKNPAKAVDLVGEIHDVELVKKLGDNIQVGTTLPVNDFSHPCPSTCDVNSALYV